MQEPFEWIHVLPDESNVEQIRQWRVRIALVACSVWLFVFLLLTPLLTSAFFVGLPRVGSVVWASELDDKVDKSVRKTISPIVQDVAEVKAAVHELTKASNVSAAAALGNTIIQATREKCKATTQGRPGDAWADRILELRQQYRVLTGERFDALTCEDV